MKRQLFALILISLWLSPMVASAIDISGCVTKEDTSGPVTNASIDLFDSDNNYLRVIGNVDSTSGCYVATEIDEGDYYLQVAPYSPSQDQKYINLSKQVTINSTSTIFDFILTPGGNISGVVTTEALIADSNNPPGVSIIATDASFQTWGWIDWDNGGTYTSQGVPPGEYDVMFTDWKGQFQDELYDNMPSSEWWADTKVTVTQGDITPGINASLHEVSSSADRYYFSWNDITTLHNSYNSVATTSTFVYMGAEINRFSNLAAVSSDEIDTFSVIMPSGTCSESTLYTDTVWRMHYHDMDNDGGPGDGLIDREDENKNLKPFIASGASCTTGTTPHQAGPYQFVMSFRGGKNGGQPLAKTISLANQGLTITQLPPVTALASTWDDIENELNLTWSSPTYPDPALLLYMQIRVYSFKNGQFLDNQVRITNLPPTGINSFTLNPDMTAVFNHKGVDQIEVQVRLYGAQNTMARTRQAYDFDAKTGTLVPAKIGMKYFDISGDGKTGQEEAVHTLKVVSGI